MSFDLNSNNFELYLNIARRVHDGILSGDFSLLGVYLPETVLKHVANLSGEYMNSFGYNNGRAELKIVSPLLSRVLDTIRNSAEPNHRWCVLVKNIAYMFEISRGSLCGADLSGLDLTECNFSSTALSSLGLKANFDNSIVRFDSFLRYRIPGKERGKPDFALDIDSAGNILLGCDRLILRVYPHDPTASQIVCSLTGVLEPGWKICKLRFSREVNSVLISATNDLRAFDASTSLHPYTEGEVPLRQFIFDGRNLIPCFDERKMNPALDAGAVLRKNAFGVSAYLEGREIARISERHCLELETGDPVRDELSARDRLFSADLRYKYENERVTDRQNRRALAFIHAEYASYRQRRSLCEINPTAADCDFDHIHPDSPISAGEIAQLKQDDKK